MVNDYGNVKHMKIKTYGKKIYINDNSYWKVVIMDDFFVVAKISKFFEMFHCFIKKRKINK